MKKIHPVILAGGSGSRLWPLSRKSYPKQFVKLMGETSLFQQAAERALSTQFLELDDIVTVTNSDYRFIIDEQLQKVGIHPGSILIEPTPKNTAAAIIVASLLIQAKEPGANVLVIPSDQIIPDIDYFHQCGVQWFRTSTSWKYRYIWHYAHKSRDGIRLSSIRRKNIY